jgi:hypothetical protein
MNAFIKEVLLKKWVAVTTTQTMWFRSVSWHFTTLPSIVCGVLEIEPRSSCQSGKQPITKSHTLSHSCLMKKTIACEWLLRQVNTVLPSGVRLIKTVTLKPKISVGVIRCSRNHETDVRVCVCSWVTCTNIDRDGGARGKSKLPWLGRTLCQSTFLLLS